MKRILLSVLSLLALEPVPAGASTAPAPAETVARLRADLLAGAGATLTLTQWCADEALASPPVIRAVRRAVLKRADSTVRAALNPAPGETIRYRNVRLACGEHVLSDADNWYLPARLTADMNRRLEETDTPFGTVVRPLAFHRRTLAATPVNRSHYILAVSAVLLDSAGRPFSFVREHYTRDLLAVRPPDR